MKPNDIENTDCRKRLDESIRRERDLEDERARLKASNAELVAALEAYHEFGIFVALVRGPSGEDIQPKLAEAQIQARAAIAKTRGQ